jgi:hypothetical protein
LTKSLLKFAPASVDPAEIKRWGKSIANDKLKTLLAKHTKPENCAQLTVPRVNREIWSSMNNFKKSADLQLSNNQQVIQQGTFRMLKACNRLAASSNLILTNN